MLISGIKINGFRGIRSTLDMRFGSGFTVITGNNGSGKTTICDAIEYLLTQRISRATPDQVEGKERLEDYVWWRGKPAAPARQITGWFTDGARDDLTWSVTPEGIRGQIKEECFFDREIAPQDPFTTLCQTSIFRDELTTLLSTDLTEGNRGAFVERAIGIVGTALYDRVAGDYEHALKRRLEAIEGRYESHRSKIAELIEDISEARAQAGRFEDQSLDEITQAARRLTGTKSADVGKLLSGLEAGIAGARRRADQLDRLRIELNAHSEEISEGESLRRQQESLRAEMTALEEKLRVAEGQHSAVAASLERAREAEPANASLAQLREQGLRLGLRDGRCPLCGSVVSRENYNNHLSAIESDISRRGAELGALVQQEVDLQRKVSHLRTSIQMDRNKYNQIAARFQLFKKAEAELRDSSVAVGVTLSEDALTSALASERARAKELEKCSEGLEAFVASQRMKDLEKKRSLLEHDAGAAAKERDVVDATLQGVHRFSTEARRVGREVLEERLATLNPLLSELYARLKPHVDFSDIKYRMRGDVKRLLRLEVGSDINPIFVFSSGQRRALGLAFLLAVYLSRRWCKLKTLVLDDPMQHVDDYRALHLVEVLSSIRQSGYQVICTVQDSDLADLLCRRLRSSDTSSGVRVELAHRPGKGVEIKDIVSVAPLPSRVLTAA
jgi:chromosome segregation protein